MGGDFFQNPIEALLIEAVERDRALHAVEVGARRSDVKRNTLRAEFLQHGGRRLLLWEHL